MGILLSGLPVSNATLSSRKMMRLNIPKKRNETQQSLDFTPPESKGSTLNPLPDTKAPPPELASSNIDTDARVKLVASQEDANRFVEEIVRKHRENQEKNQANARRDPEAPLTDSYEAGQEMARRIIGGEFRHFGGDTSSSDKSPLLDEALTKLKRKREAAAHAKPEVQLATTLEEAEKRIHRIIVKGELLHFDSAVDAGASRESEALEKLKREGRVSG